MASLYEPRATALYLLNNFRRGMMVCENTTVRMGVTWCHCTHGSHLVSLYEARAALYLLNNFRQLFDPEAEGQVGRHGGVHKAHGSRVDGVQQVACRIVQGHTHPGRNQPRMIVHHHRIPRRGLPRRILCSTRSRQDQGVGVPGVCHIDLPLGEVGHHLEHATLLIGVQTLAYHGCAILTWPWEM